MRKMILTDLYSLSHTKLGHSDQIKMLEHCKQLTETGKWLGLFTYPNCGYDLYKLGLITDEGHITTIGRSILVMNMAINVQKKIMGIK